MTVGELIAKLSKHDPDRIVILSKDSEGNGFGVLYNLETCKYDPSESEIGLEELTLAQVKCGYTDEDVMDGGIPALCLWP